MSTLAWHKARELLRRDDPSWPDAFNVQELARLQYESRPQDQRAMAAALTADIAAGRLQAAGSDRVCTFASIQSELSAALDGAPYRRRTALYDTVPTLGREPFRDWLRQNVTDEDQWSEHVRAWLGELPKHPNDVVAEKYLAAQVRNGFRGGGHGYSEANWEAWLAYGLGQIRVGKAPSIRKAAKLVKAKFRGAPGDRRLRGRLSGELNKPENQPLRDKISRR